jgi:hypothetical protein
MPDDRTEQFMEDLLSVLRRIAEAIEHLEETFAPVVTENDEIRTRTEK